MEATAMLIDEIIAELLLRWEQNPSLTPEELCHEYKGGSQYPDLLERLKQGICDYKAAAPFFQTTKEQDRSPQETGPYSPREAQSGEQSSVSNPELPPVTIFRRNWATAPWGWCTWPGSIASRDGLL